MRPNLKLFVLGGLLVAVALALVVSPFASSKPDGLDRVARDKGFVERAEDHPLDNTPVAGYSLEGVPDERLSTGLAGFVGVLLTFGVGVALFGALRAWRGRRRSRPGEPR